MKITEKWMLGVLVLLTGSMATMLYDNLMVAIGKNWDLISALSARIAGIE